MAKIVLGMGSSHGPMLSTPPEEWGQRVVADKRNKEHHYKGKTWTYEQLVEARKGEGLQKQIELPVWRERHAACRKALGELAKVFADVKPDVAVIVGNDQKEIFRDAYTPALTVFNGKTITNTMFSDERIAALPPGIAVAIPGHIPPGGATYPGAPELAEHIIKSLTSDEFDVSTLTQLPHDETPHAFGFIYRQVMLDQAVPSVPVILNTFYPPNQPSVRRCYEFGESLVQAIESWQSDARVALIASGGLTHFVIDEEVDRAIFDAMQSGSIEKVADLGEPIFQAGTSEVKNWVPVAGAMAHLGFKFHPVDYVPCYRSEAGTGNAMAFVYWRP
jgi:Catalytic LigB subunit of aromatic ring-opening dioxygenase